MSKVGTIAANLSRSGLILGGFLQFESLVISDGTKLPHDKALHHGNCGSSLEHVVNHFKSI
jgi:hypothetical protein